MCACVLAVVATLLIIYNCAVNIALRATKLIRTSMDTICVAHIIPNIFHTHTAAVAKIMAYDVIGG